MKVEIKNRFSGSVQFTAEVDASFETKSHALQIGAAVKWGLKQEADLREADLRGANLGEAPIIDAGVDKRGYIFRATYDPESFDLQITAGCRTWKTIAEAQAHFGEGYGSDGDVTECLAKIQYIETVFEARQKEAEAKTKPLAEVSA